MKNLVLVFFLVGFSQAVFCQKTNPLDCVFMDSTETETTLRSFTKDGNNVLVIAWSFWCAPCNKSLNTIAAHREGWLTENKTEVVVLSHDKLDQKQKSLSRWISKGFQFHLLYDFKNNRNSSLINASTLPTFYLLDKDGELLYRLPTGIDDSNFADLDAAIKMKQPK